MRHRFSSSSAPALPVRVRHGSVSMPHHDLSFVRAIVESYFVYKSCIGLTFSDDLNCQKSQKYSFTVADLFKQVQMMYGIVVDDCNSETCASMTAGF